MLPSASLLGPPSGNASTMCLKSASVSGVTLAGVAESFRTRSTITEMVSRILLRSAVRMPPVQRGQGDQTSRGNLSRTGRGRCDGDQPGQYVDEQGVRSWEIGGGAFQVGL